jgi:hypothetical protein
LVVVAQEAHQILEVLTVQTLFLFLLLMVVVVVEHRRQQLN